MDAVLESVADMMALAARTAPKTAGQDFVNIKIIKGEEIKRLADSMEKYGESTGKMNYDRDARGVRDSGAVLLLSLNKAENVGLNCGACGFGNCEQLRMKEENDSEFGGPVCSWRMVDLGIALGSAVKTASLFNADNRIMYRIGVVARKEGFIQGEVTIGVPLAAGGKNIFFDR